MTYGRMMAEMSAEELTYWEQLNQLSPLAPERQDVHATVVAMAAQAPWAAGGKRPELEDYLLDFGGRRKRRRARRAAGGGGALGVADSAAVLRSLAEGGG